MCNVDASTKDAIHFTHALNLAFIPLIQLYLQITQGELKRIENQIQTIAVLKKWIEIEFLRKLTSYTMMKKYRSYVYFTLNTCKLLHVLNNMLNRYACLISTI